MLVQTRVLLLVTVVSRQPVQCRKMNRRCRRLLNLEVDVAKLQARRLRRQTALEPGTPFMIQHNPELELHCWI